MEQFAVKEDDKEGPKRDKPEGVRITEERPRGPLQA